MSDPHLPAETLDYIIDYLHDTQDALRNCCLVSKSCVPRARKHLFASVSFRTIKHLESWKETFPDPSTSPARYAKALSIDCPKVVTAGSWIRSFSRVEHLNVSDHVLGHSFNQSATPLVPFHGFSPVMKSLRMVIPGLPPSQILNLVLSFPLLEDLAVIIRYRMPAGNSDGPEEGEMSTATQLPTPPIFTGSLELSLKKEMEPITRRLLSLPSGIHFRRLTLACISEGDISLITALVDGCSHSLDSLDIKWQLYGAFVRCLYPRG
jgi:hypothetical protein